MAHVDKLVVFYYWVNIEFLNILFLAVRANCEAPELLRLIDYVERGSSLPPPHRLSNQKLVSAGKLGSMSQSGI